MSYIEAPISLPSLIDHLGHEQFERNFITQVKSLAGVDHCIVLKYYDSSVGFVPKTSLTWGHINSGQALELSREYDAGSYKEDPNLKYLSHTTDKNISFRRSRKDFGKSSYAARFFDSCDIVDKFSLIRSRAGYKYCLNLYRLSDAGEYDDGDIHSLRIMQPTLLSLLEKHFELKQRQLPGMDISALILDLEQKFADILTVREREVMAYILMNYSSEAISLNMGVSINTVRTYRKRLYSKLHITSQNELMRLYIS